MILQELNNVRIEILPDCIILWCTHDKSYKYGSYYKIDKNNDNIYYVIEKETEYREILLKKGEK